jgi:hypothetical protein
MHQPSGFLPKARIENQLDAEFHRRDGGNDYQNQQQQRCVIWACVDLPLPLARDMGFSNCDPRTVSCDA